ncbi:MAG: hypothetical protein DYH02_04025 [Candidatus Omnitrophica bacterium COP1]|nr:hypothetical protein [Candidatus Omnitrophica bacterium COP1]
MKRRTCSDSQEIQLIFGNSPGGFSPRYKPSSDESQAGSSVLWQSAAFSPSTHRMATGGSVNKLIKIRDINGLP